MIFSNVTEMSDDLKETDIFYGVKILNMGEVNNIKLIGS